MTTNPVMSITDEQIAEIEREMMRCRFDGGDDGPDDPCISYDFLNILLSEREYLISRLRAAEKDAERYRALREFHWSTSDYAVVRNPKEQVKLGAQCPSGLLLDAAIDAVMEQSE